MDKHILPVALEKAYRLITHGPTVLVSARDGCVDNVMTAAWACALDFDPPKVSVVLDKATMTRTMIENSGKFVLQVPTVAQRELTLRAGTVSRHNDPEKLAHIGANLFRMEGSDLPCISGCAAWMICTLVPEPHNQQRYDLFIGEVTAAWADCRVFKDGHWQFEHADPQWRTLHHVAGGQFYAIGESVTVSD